MQSGELMATILKRGNRWFAQIRRKGFPSKSKSFDTHAEAKSWAVIHEGKIEQGDSPWHAQPLREIPLASVIDRYMAEVTPTKRSSESERLRLGKLRRDSLASVSIADLGSVHLADYRD